MMTSKKIEGALKNFIEALTDEEIRQIIAHGGYIGLPHGIDFEEFDEDDFELVIGPEDEILREGFAYCFHVEAIQEFSDGALNPPDGQDEDDEDGYLNIYPGRFTEAFVELNRQYLLDDASSVVDGIENWIASQEE